MSKFRAIVVLLCVACVSGVAAYYPSLRSFGLLLLGETDLSVAERNAIGRCENPGWLGMVRLLVQDRDTPCGSVWVGRNLGMDVSRSWQTDWVVTIAYDDTLSAKKRFRASMGALVNGREAPSDMMLLADRSALVEKDWEALWGAFFDQSFDTDWMDPIMRDRARVWRHFEQGEHHLEQMLPLARRWSRSTLGSAERQSQMSAAFWYEIGVGDGRVSGLSKDLSAREKQVGSAMEALDPVIARYSGSCADTANNACLVYALAAWRADQGVRPEDWAELESDNELELKPGSLAQLLNIAYDGDVLAIDAATQHLEEIRNWVRHEPNTRHDRLRALLLRGRSGAEVIDPTAALSDYPTSPWAAALAVDIVLGDSVAFYWKDPSDYGESYIQLGDHWVHASSAGLRSVSSPKVSVGVESGEIFAMLALEMAADRVRRHDLRVALLLAGLAERSAAVANGASAALANKCGIAEGGAPVSLGARIGAWSNLGDWPSAGPDDVQLSVGARMLIAGLEDGC